MDGKVCFYINREVFFRNTFTIYVNLALRKYQYNNIVFNQASENQPGIGRRRLEGPSGPGKEDAVRSDRMEPL
ncbi:hypothetical protein [Clostridium sp. chh4-2]|uniref:hypothetical protein n=1 Tax=Clostridium sp. chh4-2 TaxID=2067550 RepID=UPI0015E16DC7|nr:hypothetical protein [Clostridium sp. chh4-2]